MSPPIVLISAWKKSVFTKIFSPAREICFKETAAGALLDLGTAVKDGLATGVDAAETTWGAGVFSRCHPSHRRKREKENIKNRKIR